MERPLLRMGLPILSLFNFMGPAYGMYALGAPGNKEELYSHTFVLRVEE